MTKSRLTYQLFAINDMSLLRDPKVFHVFALLSTISIPQVLAYLANMSYINNKLRFVSKTKEKFTQV